MLRNLMKQKKDDDTNDTNQNNQNVTLSELVRNPGVQLQPRNAAPRLQSRRGNSRGRGGSFRTQLYRNNWESTQSLDNASSAGT